MSYELRAAGQDFSTYRPYRAVLLATESQDRDANRHMYLKQLPLSGRDLKRPLQFGIEFMQSDKDLLIPRHMGELTVLQASVKLVGYDNEPVTKPTDEAASMHVYMGALFEYVCEEPDFLSTEEVSKLSAT